MPENLEEQGLVKNPNLEIAQWKFLLGTDRHRNDQKLKNDLLQIIKENGLYFMIMDFLKI